MSGRERTGRIFTPPHAGFRSPGRREGRLAPQKIASAAPHYCQAWCPGHLPKGCILGRLRNSGKFLKKWFKKSAPFWALFWRFRGFPVKAACQTSLPEDASQQRKMAHHPSRVITEALSWVYFAVPACPGPKYTLGRASEMAHEGWCTVFSAG